MNHTVATTMLYALYTVEPLYNGQRHFCCYIKVFSFGGKNVLAWYHWTAKLVLNKEVFCIVSLIRRVL